MVQNQGIWGVTKADSLITEDSSTQLLKGRNAVAKTIQIDFDTFLKVIIVFHLVTTLNHHKIASKAVSVAASGSPCPQCQRVRRPGCTLHTLEWKGRGSFLWFQPRWGCWVDRLLQLLDVKISYLSPASVQISCCLYSGIGAPHLTFGWVCKSNFFYHDHRCWQALP